MIAATVLTVEGTYYALKTFVFDASDPIVKAGGLSSDQKELGKAK